MIATIGVEYSFKEDNLFTKEWQENDFTDFFTDEGKYLDRLAKVAEKHGESGEGFEITFTVKLVV